MPHTHYHHITVLKDPCSSSINLNICTTFNLSKLQHYYAHLMTLFGPTDDYNIEYTKQLYIDFAKDTYWATNHRDEYHQNEISYSLDI
jgi:hypothetical protein